MTTLSQQEQTKTLSKGKRKRPERAAKIVLCNPFPKYWPQVDETDAELIKDQLRKLLVKERGKPKIPWKKFMKLTKELRKERMKEIYSENVISAELEMQRKFLKVGLNEVARATRHMNINICLLAGDAQPDFVISHLVTLASTRRISVLIIPNLKEDISEILGFSSIALGFKIDADDQRLKPFNTSIKQICSKFPVPSHYERIFNKAGDIERREKKQVIGPTIIKKKISNIKKQPEISIGDFFVDVTPGPSLDTISSGTKKAGSKKVDDFIPLDASSNVKLVEKDTNQLSDDYMTNLLYIAPKFIQMQKNCNKQKKRKMMKI